MIFTPTEGFDCTRRLIKTFAPLRLCEKKVMEKEQWKDDILNSLEGIRRAEPDPQLYARIKSKTGEAVVAVRLQVVRRPYVALAAACLAALMIANVWAIGHRQVEPSSTSVYSVDSARFDLYE